MAMNFLRAVGDNAGNQTLSRALRFANNSSGISLGIPGLNGVWLVRVKARV
jgi:hypothetical protein